METQVSPTGSGIQTSTSRRDPVPVYLVPGESRRRGDERGRDGPAVAENDPRRLVLVSSP